MQTEANWLGTVNDAWIKTLTGRKMNVFAPDESQINIVDIGHALSMITRFNGHLSKYYSVAEHCYHMSFLVEPKYALAALLHDAAEAYLSDIPRPIKAMLPDIKLIEGKLINSIFDHFKVILWTDKIFKLDRSLCLTEAIKAGMDISDWGEGKNMYDELDVKIEFWDWYKAKLMFLNRFNELTEGKFIYEFNG